MQRLPRISTRKFLRLLRPALKTKKLLRLPSKGRNWSKTIADSFKLKKANLLKCWLLSGRRLPKSI